MNRRDDQLPVDDRTSDGGFGWGGQGQRFYISLRRIARGHMLCIAVGTGMVLAAIALAIVATAATILLVGIRYFLD